MPRRKDVSPITAALVQQFEAAEMSIRELGRRTGLPYQTAWSFANYKPSSLGTLDKVARCLGVAPRFVPEDREKPKRAPKPTKKKRRKVKKKRP